MNKITLAIIVAVLVFIGLSIVPSIFEVQPASCSFVVVPEWVKWVPFVLAVASCVGFFVTWYLWKTKNQSVTQQSTEGERS